MLFFYARLDTRICDWRQIKLAVTAEKVDLIDQRRIRRHLRSVSLSAIGQLGRNSDFAFAADFHAHDALLEARYHLARSDLELKRDALFAGGVEFCSISQIAGVVNHDRTIRLGTQTPALLEIYYLQTVRCELRF